MAVLLLLHVAVIKKETCKRSHESFPESFRPNGAGLHRDRLLELLVLLRFASGSRI